jgi:uncharacterized protein (DUF2236 family)
VTLQALEKRLDRAWGRAAPAPAIDFSQPSGTPALAESDSISWRIFKNPVALFAGGITAVILELAEPRVRTGVWEHTAFRTDPLGRMQRTGLAAMMTVYGPRPAAEAMIAGISRRHGQVRGTTPGGEAYAASDPELLDWVQATASFGFMNAYHRLVTPLSSADRDRFYAEGAPAARLYGATGAPTSEAEVEALFERMRPRLEPSPIIEEFLAIIDRTPALPGPLRLLQPPLIRAAIGVLPAWAQARLGLEGRGPRPLDGVLLGAAGRLADRIPIPSAPPAQACLRMGLPGNWLYRR